MSRTDALAGTRSLCLFGEEGGGLDAFDKSRGNFGGDVPYVRTKVALKQHLKEENAIEVPVFPLAVLQRLFNGMWKKCNLTA